jgi:hypothetical protein
MNNNNDDINKITNKKGLSFHDSSCNPRFGSEYSNPPDSVGFSADFRRIFGGFSADSVGFRRIPLNSIELCRIPIRFTRSVGFRRIFDGFSADFRRIFSPKNNPPDSVGFSSDFRRIFGGCFLIQKHDFPSCSPAAESAGFRRIPSDFGETHHLSNFSCPTT